MLQLPLSDELKKELIFIVDDDTAILHLMQQTLQKEGFSNIKTIQDSKDVITEFINNRPSLILLDINMPGMSGFDVVASLKNLEKTSLPPIVFLTGDNSNDLRVKAFESGVLDFIGKPYNRLELLSRVKNLLALDIAHQELADRNMSLEKIVKKRTEELEKTQLQMVQKLGRAAEYRDNDTGTHILRMSYISSLMAKHLNFSDSEINNILYASPMHDVGKIAIPDHILMKPEKFNDAEWEIMKTHTTLGYELLKGDSPLLMLASEIALSHHERWDGTGYPNGLAGEAIPVSCRIVAIADVFDALVSDRPYKEAWAVTDACDFINEQSGKQFDPKVVDKFNVLLPEILRIRNDFQDEVA